MKRQYRIVHVPVRRKRKRILRRQHFYVEARTLDAALQKFRREMPHDAIVSISDVTEAKNLVEWLASVQDVA